MISSSLSIVILAAGKGTRMKSNKAKVLHEVFFAPMVQHVVAAATPLVPAQTIVIVGHQQAAVEEAMKSFAVDFAVQEKQLGTGHAVLAAEKTISGDTDTILILCGDTPLIKAETLQEMYSYHLVQNAELTLMTTLLEDPTNYGRILCNASGKVQGIVEQKDATPEQLSIKEINAGIYCVDRNFLFSTLKKVGTDNSQGEVYLTDIVKIGVEAGLSVEKFTTEGSLDVLGVNSRVELADAHQELQLRRNRELMLNGVSMVNPETICVAPDSSVAPDSLLEAGVQISCGSNIEGPSKIGQGTILKNCTLGDNVTIGPYCYLENSTIDSDTILAPFTRKS